MDDIKKICESSINLKVISFFHENPSTVDTARDIAAWLNHNHEEIKKVLDYLVSQNILIAHRSASTIAYAYTQGKEIVNRVERILREKRGEGYV